MSRLVTPERWEESNNDILAPTAEDVKQQLAESYETVDLQQTELHSSLIALGVSQSFLQLAVRGVKGVSEFFNAWATARLGRPLIPSEVPPRIVDAWMMLQTGRKHSLSPWTGAMASSRDSLGPCWYLFGNATPPFISGQVSGLPLQAHDTLWILPGIRKILFVPAGVDRARILENCAWLITQLAKRIRRVLNYLKTEERKVVICDFHCEHFGHYVWNVISAWGALFEFVPPDQVGTIACAIPERYFGSVKDVFSLQSHKITEKRIRSPDQVYDLIFGEGCLLSSIHANSISDFTASSVVSHSMNRCEPEFKERLLAMQRERWPIVLFSLRLQNRSWVDQMEGFTEIAMRLRKDFPNAGFVIHGLSKGVPLGWTTSRMSLEAEIEASADLERALGGPKDVANAVGLSIHESVAISNLCDVFIAPVGSGMALYKWLTNKPGVAFSNTFCINPTNPLRWAFTVFDGFRANIVPSTYIPLSAVADVESDHDGQLSRANFTLDRSVLYATLRNLLLTLPWESRPIPQRAPARGGPS